MKSQILALLLAVSALAAPQISQASPGHGYGRGHWQGGGQIGVERLEKMGIQLTPEQKAKIEQIQAQAKNKINGILTAEQRQARENLQATRKNNSLSAEQKQKLRQSWTESRQQLNAILTPEQQQQLKQKHQGQQRWGRRGQGGEQGHRSKGRMDLAARLTAQGIQLTPDQQRKIAELQRQKKETRENIYTPEQRQAFQNMKSQRQAIKLSVEQKKQLRDIYKSTREELKSVLTAEQQQQLRQKRHRHGTTKPN